MSLLTTSVGQAFAVALQQIKRQEAFACTKIAVAVSGGSDSTALLLLAYAWCQVIGQPLVAFTVDHHLRPESTREALRVQRYAQSLGIPHEILYWKPAATLSRGHIEKTARRARYDALTEACWRHQTRVLLVGHTRDDQIETMLLRAVQGSGDFGLAGMSLCRLIHAQLVVARPLLCVSRFDLQHLLLRYGVSWTNDSSNNDPFFRRVLWRKGLQHTDQDTFRELVLVNRFYVAKRRLHTLAAIRFLKHHAFFLKNRLFLRVEPFRQISLSLQRYVLRRVISGVGGKAYPPNALELTRACQKLVSLENIRFTLGRALIKKSKNLLHFSRERRNMPPAMQLPSQRLICWDGRFWFCNTTEELYWIFAPKDGTDPCFYKETLVFPDLPAGVI
ncbi:MAG: tRNA lysidine(34) synthetase TilS, partial [Holosporales bacterium]|nr:tRNA lysidine(34) synthetase TilS [Holosporales bacterium]